MKLTKPVRYSLVGVALVALAAVGYFWVWPLYVLATARVPEDRCPGHERFNPVIWQDTTRVYSDLKPRGCMVNDLLVRYRLVGMTRDAVVRLLGEPKPTEYFREYDLVYWLGPEPGWLSIDSEWLVMKLDAAGRVSEASVLTD